MKFGIQKIARNMQRPMELVVPPFINNIQQIFITKQKKELMFSNF